MMFRYLSRDIEKEVGKAKYISDRIEAEIENLSMKREKRIEEINALQEALPIAKANYLKLAKVFGNSETEVRKKGVLHAKRVISRMARRYSEAQQSLKEIEESLKVLEGNLEAVL